MELPFRWVLLVGPPSGCWGFPGLDGAEVLIRMGFGWGPAEGWTRDAACWLYVLVGLPPGRLKGVRVTFGLPPFFALGPPTDPVWGWFFLPALLGGFFWTFCCLLGLQSPSSLFWAWLGVSFPALGGLCNCFCYLGEVFTVSYLVFS